MKLMPLQNLGAREISPGVIQFGVYFPWVSSQDGNRIFVKIIHENDQFLQAVQPLSFELTHAIDPTYSDYWSCQVNIPQTPGPAGSSWGKQGTYVYRYEVHSPTVGILDWVVDPFGREFGTGKLSAFTLGYQDHPWSNNEATWKTPPMDELIVYELQLEEFGIGIDGTIDKLDYLADLGINCLEIMPISNVAMRVDWGYMPVGYFGVDERFGNRADFQRLVDAAHQHGIAVILDAVYGLTDGSFTYSDLYRRLGYVQNPFLGAFGKDYFGESTDFSRQFTQDFFFSVNYLWLDRFHVDGFRYDCVPEFWDGPTGVGYANLVFNTYQAVKEAIPAGGHWQRFTNAGQINLIQCAEQLEDPQGILNQSYSNATWQNSLLGASQAVAHGSLGSLSDMGTQLGLIGYPEQLAQNGDTLHKSVFQYIENHDHERFVCNFGLDNSGEVLLQDGDRSLWYKVQPYFIGMLTGKGVPMLWQGQEFGENYWVPPGGIGRVLLFRPVRWDYFYDEVGKQVISLVRRLIRLRKQFTEFQKGSHYFYNQWDQYQSHGLLLFSRSSGNRFSLIALNFTDSDQTVPFWFPLDGNYQELLDGQAGDSLTGVIANNPVQLHIPSNYGRIWSRSV